MYGSQGTGKLSLSWPDVGRVLLGVLGFLLGAWGVSVDRALDDHAAIVYALEERVTALQRRVAHLEQRAGAGSAFERERPIGEASGL